MDRNRSGKIYMTWLTVIPSLENQIRDSKKPLAFYQIFYDENVFVNQKQLLKKKVLLREMLATSWKHKGKYIYIQMTFPYSSIENLVCTRHCSGYFNVKVHVEFPNLLQKLISLVCSWYGMNLKWTLCNGSRWLFGMSNHGRQCKQEHGGIRV